MLKLRESFSLKVHLHIRQDMLQRLWDKYVPASSQEYGQIELIYLKDALGNIEKQPEQIQLLLHLILKNKMMQLNLMQYPAPVKICQRQMESSLQRMERYYAVQLKCLNLTMYRTVRQYFTLLEQAQENDRRYQGWQKNYREIEKQKEEYRLISLFSEKLRDYLVQYPVNTLRTMEQEFVNSLSETEYRTLAEELIWQEKPELIAYLKECEKDQCKEIVKELEKDTDMRQILSSIQKQSAKKKLIAAAYKLEQKEFSRFYWQVVDQKDINPQIVIWKKDRTEMVRLIDELGLERLQKVWTQIETVGSVEESKHVFTEKMLHLQNQYQENKSRNFQEQIAVILKENALENITDILDIEHLMQDVSMTEYTEKPVRDIEEPELGFGESEQLVLRDGAYQVIRNLEREQEIRRERIEQQQAQAVEIFQEAYHQILRTESVPNGQQKDAVQSAEQIFPKQETVKKLLRIEDKEFAEKLLRIENRELAEKLLRIEDRELAEKLLRIENREFATKLLQNSDRQLPDVSYSSLWEWGETLLFHPEHQQEWEDADILADLQQEVFSSDEAKQEDAQTQVIRHQIEIAKNRNRLQSLIRQINHQTDMQLVYMDAQLRLPQVQTLLQYVQQLDEEQYGALVKELVQIIKIQKLTNEESETAAVHTGEENNLTAKLLRIEDKEFIEKLLQIEDREFAKKLLQVEDRELVEKLLQVENKEFAKKLLQAEDKEFVEKLLQNDDIQLQDVSHRSLWEWGEALLQHPSADEAQQENDEAQMTQQQIEIEKDRNHLQSLIGQINHRADVQLEYTDAQIRMPQIQALLHYIRQLDVRQYGAFVKELAQVTMIQKRSYDEPKMNLLSGTRSVSLEQRRISYPILVRDIENYEKQRQSEFYRDIRKIEHKIFPQSVTGYSNTGDYVQRTAAKELMSYNTGIDEYGLTLYEEAEKEYAQITTYERNRQENRYQSQELEYSIQRASISEEEQQRKELRMQQENAQIKSMQEQLDNKLKEVEHQLRKVEDSTKAKENVGTFAEQVKRQLYEELHVEKLRRGLI